MQLPEKKRESTGNPRGRPTAQAVIARTNRKVDEFFKPKAVVSTNTRESMHGGEQRSAVQSKQLMKKGPRKRVTIKDVMEDDHSDGEDSHMSYD